MIVDLGLLISQFRLAFWAPDYNMLTNHILESASESDPSSLTLSGLLAWVFGTGSATSAVPVSGPQHEVSLLTLPNEV